MTCCNGMITFTFYLFQSGHVAVMLMIRFRVYALYMYCIINLLLLVWVSYARNSYGVIKI